MNSATVYGRMARVLETHSTPSESVRKFLLSVYFGCNISPPLIKHWARKAGYTLYSWGLIMALGKGIWGWPSEGHEQRFPFQFPELPPASFYRLADIKTSWAKAVDYYAGDIRTIVTEWRKRRRWRLQAVRSGPKPYPSGAHHSPLLCNLPWARLGPWLCFSTHQPSTQGWKQSNRVVTPRVNQNALHLHGMLRTSILISCVPCPDHDRSFSVDFIFIPFCSFPLYQSAK